MNQVATTADIVYLDTRRSSQETNSNVETASRSPLFELSDSAFRSYVESVVMMRYLGEKTNPVGEHDGPFDPIYFASLQADPVSHDAVDRLSMYLDIQDLSETVEFRDGLDA